MTLKEQLANYSRLTRVNANVTGTLKLLRTPCGKLWRALSTPLHLMPLATATCLEPDIPWCLQTKARARRQKNLWHYEKRR